MVTGDIKLLLNIDGLYRFHWIDTPRPVVEFIQHKCHLRTLDDDEVILYTHCRHISVDHLAHFYTHLEDRDLLLDDGVREALLRHLPITGVRDIVSTYASQFAITWGMFKSFMKKVVPLISVAAGDQGYYIWETAAYEWNVLSIPVIHFGTSPKPEDSRINSFPY